jgi:hypothetical protein
MAVAETATVNGTSGLQASFTISITVSGSNPVLIVGSNLHSVTATFNAPSWSLGSGTPVEVKNVRGSTGVFTSIWAIPAPTGGAGTITVNPSTTVLCGGNATNYSGADQSTPSSAGDAVTSVSNASAATLTPANLAASDASYAMGCNIVAGNWTSATPNQRAIDNTDDPGYLVGDATGTTGVTINNDGGMVAGDVAMVAVRIKAVAAGGFNAGWATGATKTVGGVF